MLAVAATCAAGLVPATEATASTNVTVQLVAGTLSISEPGTANFGSVTSTAAGATLTGHLGSTTITDARASLAGWTVTVSASNFSDGAGHTLSATKLKTYVATGDGPTVTSGVAVPTTTYATAATALTLSNSAQNFVTASTTGSNVVSYNPTVVVTFDSQTIAGTYTGTITQSVS